MLQEFKQFAMRGNVLDLAVGVVIGAAFGKIVGSFVGDVLTPVLGLVLGGVDFSQLFISLKGGTYANLAEAKAANVPVLAYGAFLQAIFDFVIVAFAIFLLVKGVNSMQRKQAAAPAPPPAPSAEEKLLTEIRDALRAR
jgi:large conductance mechanosensitive channel